LEFTDGVALLATRVQAIAAESGFQFTVIGVGALVNVALAAATEYVTVPGVPAVAVQVLPVLAHPVHV